DQKMISTNDLKLEVDNRKSPPAMEAMMTTICEETNELEKSTDDCLDEMVKTGEGQIATDTIQDVSVNDQSEHGEAENTSKDTVKECFLVSATINGKIINMFASWYFYRSLSSAHLKKRVKAVPSATPVSSQYLGTLKVLEDKHVQKNSIEFNKADSLRAAAFQNWLEKKRVFLRELKRIKKKAENLRNDTEKKEAVKREEAIASFEAWKKKKGREAKKLNEKKKLEELKKKKAAEQNEEKIEAAQKPQMQHLVCYMMISCSSLSLYRNEKKEEYLKQKKVEKILERRKQEIQQAKTEEKNKKALEEYERWL
ncbi:MAP9 protein, partial [Steatornis caripensis]|nr:MAP9 protein [Steatornis caripensis]